MSLQKQFRDFNDAIRLDYEKKSELSEKREIITNLLNDIEDLPSFDVLNQGSYAMNTGIEPISTETKKQEYDIDIALLFNEDKDNLDPIKVKESIYNQIKGHTDYGAKIKKPCVTLTYKKNSEKAFHVDIVSYAYQTKESKNSQLYLAKGKSSDDPEKGWDKGDPRGIIDYIKNKIEDANEREQCRRIIRYLKRWKSLKFGNDHAEPASVGITFIVFDLFKYFENDDLSALIYIVQQLKSLFSLAGYDEASNPMYSINYSMPSSIKVEPNHNLFGKMTDRQMTTFKQKTDKLLEELKSIEDEPDLGEQCRKLRIIFGDDFPIPEKKDYSCPQVNYIPTSSSSGMF